MLKMASLQPILLSLTLCFALVFNGIGAETVNIPAAGEEDVVQNPKHVGSDSELQLKIHQLESSLEEKSEELKKKDNEIALLQNNISSLQEELKKVKFEAQSNIKQKIEVISGWLPVPVTRFMYDLEKKWQEHGKPSADAFLQKAFEKKAEAVQWAEPHVETIKTKWVPAVKEKWLITSTHIEPHMRLLHDRALEVYVASKSAVTPHVLKVQELADPYFQEVKKFSKPYIDYIDSITRPYLDKLQVFLQPCMKIAVGVYGRITKSASKFAVHVYEYFVKPAPTYHNQARDNVEGESKLHELTRSFASKKLVWFTVSALLALPVLLVCSATFSKKTKSGSQSKSHHPRRTAKRGHSDN